MFFADMPEKVDRCRVVLRDLYYCAENVDEFGIYVKVNLLKYKSKNVFVFAPQAAVRRINENGDEQMKKQKTGKSLLALFLVVCMLTGSSGGSYKLNTFNVRAVSKF